MGGRSPIQEHKISKTSKLFLTGSVLLQLLEGSQQSLVALVAFIILGVEQDLLGINEQTGDSGDDHREAGRRLN